MRIGVLRTQVPFVNGGAERHAARLCKALREYGYDAVEITVPFKWYPAGTLVDSILASRLLDVSEYDGVPIDLAVGLKFPAYLMRHPEKVFWIIHQHRQAYDQWDSGVSDLLQYPDGQAIRRFIHSEDQMALAGTHRPIFANSKNVANRVERYLDRKAIPLYHPPPLEEEMRLGKYGDYIFAPGRINPSKRLDLVVDMVIPLIMKHVV
jgi:glycosyltransferase involved in cell wall biosynthesis